MVQLESPKLVRGGDESGKESGDSEVGNYSTQTAFLPRDLWSNFFIQTGVAKKVNTFFLWNVFTSEKKIWVIPTMTDLTKKRFCLFDF